MALLVDPHGIWNVLARPKDGARFCPRCPCTPGGRRGDQHASGAEWNPRVHANTEVRTLKLSCCKHSHAPKLCGQTAAAQEVPAPPLESSNTPLCRSVGIGIVPLRSGLVNGVLEAVVLELVVNKLSASVAVNSEVQRVRQVGMIIVDLCQESLDGFRCLSLGTEQRCIYERPRRQFNKGTQTYKWDNPSLPRDSIGRILPGPRAPAGTRNAPAYQ